MRTEKIEDRPVLKKHTILLFEGDYDKLQTLFPSNGGSWVIRKLVRNFLNDTEKGQKKAPKGLEMEVPL